MLVYYFCESDPTNAIYYLPLYYAQLDKPLDAHYVQICLSFVNLCKNLGVLVPGDIQNLILELEEKFMCNEGLQSTVDELHDEKQEELIEFQI